MAKLHFRYGTMNASKTANALMLAYNYQEQGRKALIVQAGWREPRKSDMLESRTGMSAPAISPEKLMKMSFSELGMYDCLIIDEAQFSTKELCNVYADIADYANITVFCFGLKTDFQGNLFEGSKYLLELADEIQECKTICWCGEAAKFNAKVGEDKYVSLCRKHYREGRICSNERSETLS